MNNKKIDCHQSMCKDIYASKVVSTFYINKM